MAELLRLFGTGKKFQITKISMCDFFEFLGLFKTAFQQRKNKEQP